MQVDRESLAGKGWVTRALPPLALAGKCCSPRAEKFALTAKRHQLCQHGQRSGLLGSFFPVAPMVRALSRRGALLKRLRHSIPDIAAGDRFYGYVPMASHFIAQPGSVSANGFTDAAEHRAERAVIYNQYQRVTGFYVSRGAIFRR
ncbi:MAG: DUF2855 family protein [Parasphingorhabdus sp.]|nr:DUF2855 family protein [Parasphingorhabdus sp.]